MGHSAGPESSAATPNPLGVPSTLSWNGSYRSAPEIPAGVASTAMEYAATKGDDLRHPVPTIRPRYPAIPTGLPVSAQHEVPGWDTQPHHLPAHARRPSATAQPEMPNATTPSSHQAPSIVLAAARRAPP